MARADVISKLMATKRSALNFNYDLLGAPPLLSMLSPYDITQIEDICKDPRLNSKTKEKREYINQILVPRGFKRFASGTNRIAYKFLEDQSILLKTAISENGMDDSPSEYRNQFLLKPFCSKCFEVSPRGAIGLFERVDPITSVQQYYSISDEIFNLLDQTMGKYIMADVGTKFFMNIGIRKGFGPVFLDYPMLYELDGAKLFCNVVDPLTGIPCGGEIDYDNGYNFLYCTKCKKQYLAKQLAKGNYGDKILFKGRKEYTRMKVAISRGNEVVKESNSIISTKTYVDNIRKKKEEESNRKLKVNVYKPQRGTSIPDPTVEEKEDPIPITETSKADAIVNEKVHEKIDKVEQDVETTDPVEKPKAEVEKKPSPKPKKKICAPYPAPDPEPEEEETKEDTAQQNLSNMEMNMEEDEEENETVEDQVEEESAEEVELGVELDDDEEVEYNVIRRPDPEPVDPDFNPDNY